MSAMTERGAAFAATTKLAKAIPADMPLGTLRRSTPYTLEELTNEIILTVCAGTGYTYSTRIN
jgi:hypothetical protein